MTIMHSVIFLIFVLQILRVHGLGSGGTIAVSYGSGTICGIVSGERVKRIQCYRGGEVIELQPRVSFDAIAGGRDGFCAVRSGGYSFLCWDDIDSRDVLRPKRVYYNVTTLVTEIAMENDRVCGMLNGTGVVECWRGGSPDGVDGFESISSGLDYSCGILRNSRRVLCWGDNDDRIAREIQQGFGNVSMMSLVAGPSHACGLEVNGSVVCRGSNSSGSGKLNAPSGPPMEFSGFALGVEHSCGIRQSNGSVVCWGGAGRSGGRRFEGDGDSFAVIVAGMNFTCGVTMRNFSVLCWGGWAGRFGTRLGLSPFLPGRCVRSSCNDCGIFPGSGSLCFGEGVICRSCFPTPTPTPTPNPTPPPPPPRSSSGALSTGLLVFAIVGSVGFFSSACVIIYCVWTGTCCGKKVHNSVQPTIANTDPPVERSRSIRRQSSGPSSKHEVFSFSELSSATNGFSLENKIGGGSFGIVYRGKLADGREVAIKRGNTNTGSRVRRFQEKETAFESEIAFLSRLHHKHLVCLVGYCEEEDERLLVYEDMKNGALYDHLHDKNNVENLNSWKLRIKIALDAARGIEYLHSYAEPPIIHRDIKSSNILIDSSWTARVSDFGLSLIWQETGRGNQPMKAAGTVGYIDPEYYALNVLTTKSDVYGLGVVLLELLTGKRAIFRDGDDPVSIVDYAVPEIVSGKLEKVLDFRVGPPEVNEWEAVELVAYTAMLCVRVEGKQRPSMTDIVANLERALVLCQYSHGSISSTAITIDPE